MRYGESAWKLCLSLAWHEDKEYKKAIQLLRLLIHRFRLILIILLDTVYMPLSLLDFLHNFELYIIYLFHLFQMLLVVYFSYWITPQSREFNASLGNIILFQRLLRVTNIINYFLYLVQYLASF